MNGGYLEKLSANHPEASFLDADHMRNDNDGAADCGEFDVGHARLYGQENQKQVVIIKNDPKSKTVNFKKQKYYNPYAAILRL